jgi:large subunit ribosomal protein L35
MSYKLKTRKAASKRMERTPAGKLKHKKAFGSHLLGKKSKKRKHGLRGSAFIDKADAPNLLRSVPYFQK